MTTSIEFAGTEVGRGSFEESHFEEALALGYALLHDQTPDAAKAQDAMRWAVDILTQSLHTDRALETVGLMEEMLTATNAICVIPAGREMSYTDDAAKRALASTLVLSSMADTIMEQARSEPDPRLAARYSSLLMTAFGHDPDRATERTTGFLAQELSTVMEYAQNLAAASEPPPAPGTSLREDDGSDPHVLDDELELFAELEQVHRGLVPLIYRSDAAGRRTITQTLGQLAKKAKTDRYAASSINMLLREEDAHSIVCMLADVPSYNMAIAREQGYGYRPPKPGRMSFYQYEEECLRRMLSLEGQEPGICRTLYDLFGIRNYARFSEGMLLRQYHGRTREYAERVYFIEATSDDGSATYNSVPKIEKAMAELEAQGVGAVLVEVSTHRELKKFARLARMAGWGPVRFILSDSHGDFNDIILGEQPLDCDDAGKWLGALVAETLTEDGTLIINACLTAASDHGFASTLHQTSGREVHGSRAGTWLYSLQVDVDEHGIPHIEADIRYSKKWEKTRGEPMRPFRSETARQFNPNVGEPTPPGSTSVEQLCHSVMANLHALPTEALIAAREGTYEAMLKLLEAASNSGHPDLIDALLATDEAVQHITRALDHTLAARDHSHAYVRSIT